MATGRKERRTTGGQAKTFENRDNFEERGKELLQYVKQDFGKIGISRKTVVAYLIPFEINQCKSNVRNASIMCQKYSFVVTPFLKKMNFQYEL